MNYYKLLEKDRWMKDAIKREKKRLNQSIRKKHTGLIKMFDICMVLIVLFHLASVFMTGMVVNQRAAEQGITLEYKEINPAAAEEHNLEEHPQSRVIYTMMIKHIVIMCIIICAYIYLRYNMISERGLWQLGFMIVFLLYTTSYDFFGNFGLYLGRLIWA